MESADESIGISSDPSTDESAPKRGKGRRGRGRAGRGRRGRGGQGRGTRSKGKNNDDEPELESSTLDPIAPKPKLEGSLESQVAKRMAAFLFACAGAGSLKASASVAYIFSISRFRLRIVDDDDDQSPMFQEVWQVTGLVCSMHYSQRTWVMGKLTDHGGVPSFELSLPLEIYQTDELMQIIYTRFREYDCPNSEFLISASRCPYC